MSSNTYFPQGHPPLKFRVLLDGPRSPAASGDANRSGDAGAARSSGTTAKKTPPVKPIEISNSTISDSEPHEQSRGTSAKGGQWNRPTGSGKAGGSARTASAETSSPAQYQRSGRSPRLASSWTGLLERADRIASTDPGADQSPSSQQEQRERQHRGVTPSLASKESSRGTPLRKHDPARHAHARAQLHRTSPRRSPDPIQSYLQRMGRGTSVIRNEHREENGATLPATLPSKPPSVEQTSAVLSAAPAESSTAQPKSSKNTPPASSITEAVRLLTGEKTARESTSGSERRGGGGKGDGEEGGREDDGSMKKQNGDDYSEDSLSEDDSGPAGVATGAAAAAVAAPPAAGTWKDSEASWQRADRGLSTGALLREARSSYFHETPRADGDQGTSSVDDPPLSHAVPGEELDRTSSVKSPSASEDPFRAAPSRAPRRPPPPPPPTSQSILLDASRSFPRTDGRSKAFSSETSIHWPDWFLRLLPRLREDTQQDLFLAAAGLAPNEWHAWEAGLRVIGSHLREDVSHVRRTRQELERKGPTDGSMLSMGEIQARYDEAVVQRDSVDSDGHVLVGEGSAADDTANAWARLEQSVADRTASMQRNLEEVRTSFREQAERAAKMRAKRMPVREQVQVAVQRAGDAVNGLAKDVDATCLPMRIRWLYGVDELDTDSESEDDEATPAKADRRPKEDFVCKAAGLVQARDCARVHRSTLCHVRSREWPERPPVVVFPGSVRQDPILWRKAVASAAAQLRGFFLSELGILSEEDGAQTEAERREHRAELLAAAEQASRHETAQRGESMVRQVRAAKEAAIRAIRRSADVDQAPSLLPTPPPSDRDSPKSKAAWEASRRAIQEKIAAAEATRMELEYRIRTVESRITAVEELQRRRRRARLGWAVRGVQRTDVDWMAAVVRASDFSEAGFRALQRTKRRMWEIHCAREIATQRAERAERTKGGERLPEEGMESVSASLSEPSDGTGSLDMTGEDDLVEPRRPPQATPPPMLPAGFDHSPEKGDEEVEVHGDVKPLRVPQDGETGGVEHVRAADAGRMPPHLLEDDDSGLLREEWVVRAHSRPVKRTPNSAWGERRPSPLDVPAAGRMTLDGGDRPASASQSWIEKLETLAPH